MLMEIESSLAIDSRWMDVTGWFVRKRKRKDQALSCSFYSNVPFIELVWEGRRRRRRSRLDLSQIVPRVKIDAPTISTGRATTSSRSSLSINPLNFHISNLYISLHKSCSKETSCELVEREQRADSKQRMKVGRLVHVDLLSSRSRSLSQFFFKPFH